MAAKKRAGTATPPAAPPAPQEKHVGTVEHYYPKVQAAAVRLDGDLKLGDTIRIQGHSDDYTEKVTSMQLDHASVQEGHAGQSIGVRVPVKVHEHSEVLKVSKPATPAKPAAPARAKKAAKARKAPRPAGKAKPAKPKARRAGGKAKAAKRTRARAGKAGRSAGSRRRAGKRPSRSRPSRSR